jgi:hypothetical protein
MKKLFFLSSLFIIGACLMSFTSNKDKNLSLKSTPIVGANSAMSESSTFTQSCESRFTSDQREYYKWYKNWTSFDQSNLNAAENVVAAY